MKFQLWKQTSAVLGVGFLLTSLSAFAGTVSFDFTKLSPNVSSSTTISNALSAQMQSQNPGMPGLSVTVTGALTTNSYNGDGNVVGTTLSGQNVGINSSNASSKTFLINNNINGGSSQKIDMAFTGLSISSVSFMFEIFPNANCTLSSCTGEKPDFELFAGNSLSSLSQIFSKTATGVNGSASCGSANATTHECSLQLGPTAYSSNLAAGTQALEFQDWPPEIGISNLTVTFNTPNPVPEPGSMLLFGSGLIGLAGVVRRKAHKLSA